MWRVINTVQHRKCIYLRRPVYLTGDLNNIRFTNPLLQYLKPAQMVYRMNWKTLFVLVCSTAMIATSCKNGKLFGKKKESSDVTGWNYNDKDQGGYQVAREKEQRTGPGLIFVQGGTFTMGATEEDVMGDWNNIPRRVTVNSFYI